MSEPELPSPRQLAITLRLLERLADGRFHSGEELGAALGMGRGGVWRLVRAIEALGFQVDGVTGKGYRLAEPLVLLDAARIRDLLEPYHGAMLADLTVLPTVDSTNRWLMGRALSGGMAPAVVVTEHQSGGRGRRGRHWLSPFGRNLYLSMLWYFDELPHPLPACSLVVAVQVAHALLNLGIHDVALKWPNDVYAGGRKLAGVLLELVGEAAGPYKVVVGVGVNVNMVSAAIDQPWTSMRLCSGRDWDRNLVAGRLVDGLMAGLARFAREGLGPFREGWDTLDMTRGHRVVVQLPQGSAEGRALGPDADGALRVRTARGVERFHAGEVSLRPGP